MLLAHLSDPHVIDWSGEPALAFANKRVTGWANFRFRRAAVHRREVLEAVLDDVAASGADHVAVTGDLSSLAFAREIRGFVELLVARGLGPDRVSIVPGNHDAYTRRAWRNGVFLREAGPFATCELEGGRGGFPFVRLRGGAAIVGLSSAVARPPFLANGLVGQGQARRLAALLGRPELAARLPVLLVHHPLAPHPRLVKELQGGLLDRDRVLAVLRDGLGGRRALVLCGHWHRRAAVRLDLPGTVLMLQAPSASYLDGGPDRTAAYHLIEIEGTGPEARVRGVEVRGPGQNAARVETLDRLTF